MKINVERPNPVPCYKHDNHNKDCHACRQETIRRREIYEQKIIWAASESIMTSGRLSIDLIGTDMEIKNRLRNILSELIDGDGYPFERRNGYGAKVFQETFWRLVKQRWTSYVPERRKKKGDKAQKGDTLIFV